MRRKIINPLGLAMLDIISNSLAAGIILFLVVSAIQKPFIPPERSKGTLYIEYILEAETDPEMANSLIWLEPPINDSNPSQCPPKRFWGAEEINQLNSDWCYYKSFQDCGDFVEEVNSRGMYIPPCVNTYIEKNGNQIIHLVMRDPIMGTWKSGIIYRDHLLLEEKAQIAEVTINLWYVKDRNNNSGNNPTKDRITYSFYGPSDNQGFEFTIPKWYY
jgi:hypothetical protein